MLTRNENNTSYRFIHGGSYLYIRNAYLCTVSVLVSAAFLLIPLQTYASVQGDGTANGHARTTSSSDWTFNGDFTIAFWFKTSSADGMALNSSGASGNWQVGHWLSGIFFCDMTATDVSADVNSDNGAWHSAIYTRSGSTQTCYVDNTSIGTPASNSNTRPSPDSYLSVANNNAGSSGWNGKIAHVAIYKGSVWTSGERSTYQSSFGCTVPTGAKVLYRFASSASLNTDDSGFSHTLTPQGTGAGWTYSTDEPSGGPCASGATFQLWPLHWSWNLLNNFRFA